MKARAVAIVLLVVAASAIAVSLCLQRGNAEVPIDHAESRADAQANAMTPRMEGASGTSTGNAVRTDASTRSGCEGSTAPGANEPIVLRGTFIVVDERGVEHASEDGTFALESWRGFTRTQADVVLTRGAWELPVERLPEHLVVGEALIGRRAVRCDTPPCVDETNQPIVLRGSWLAPVMLRVLGDDTGVDLTSVRIVQLARWADSRLEHPGNDAETSVVVAAASSPVRFVPTRVFGTYFVCAPGYAWHTLELDSATTKPLVRLVPGGDMQLTITGHAPPEGAVVRLTGVDENNVERRVAAITPNPFGPTRIDGLQVGTVQVAIEKGQWYRDSIVMGKTELRVVAGTTVFATIHLPVETKAPPMVRAAGTLVVPQAWRSFGGLTIDPIGATKAWGAESIHIGVEDLHSAPGGQHYWDAGRLLAGKWQVLVIGCEYRAGFELPPQGDEHVRIVVPNPCDVRVRFLDADTDKLIESWGEEGVSLQRDGDWLGGGDMARQADGSFLAQTLPGRILIGATTKDHSESLTQHDVVAGANEFVVSIPRTCGVRIVLKDGTVVIPWPWDTTAQLLDGKKWPVGTVGFGNRWAVKEPGEFALKIDPMPGYELIPPRKVTVKAGEWTTIEIQMRRKP